MFIMIYYRVKITHIFLQALEHLPQKCVNRLVSEIRINNIKNWVANTQKIKFHFVTKPNLLRRIISVYSENYAKCIFCEQNKELFELKEGDIYTSIKDGASKFNVCVCNKTEKRVGVVNTDI